jgi:hypothetical protein
MGSFGCLFECYSNSSIEQPNKEKLVANIIKNLLFDILNEYDRVLCKLPISGEYITLSNITQSKNTYYHEIDKIMEELSEILEDISQNKK